MICLTSSNFRANLRALRGFVLATMGLLIWYGCDREPEPSAQQLPSVGSEVDSTALTDEDGHHRMLAELRHFAARSPREHPILGDMVARDYRRRLDELASARAPSVPLESALLWRARLGHAELRPGNLDEGLRHLTTVHLHQKRASERGTLSPELAAAAAFRLGVGYMRLGETENCIHHYSPDSCLLPIRGDGIHKKQRGSRNAIIYFAEAMQKVRVNSSLYLKAQWLLNIMYMTIGGYPEEVPPEYLIEWKFFESEQPFPRFANVAPKLGLSTFDGLGGAIIDDFTGDNYLDIVVSTWDPNEQMHFFRNNRDGTFTELTEQANLMGLVGANNLVQADYDNDGDVDILMLRGGWMRQFGQVPNSLLRNNGDETFTDVTFVAGLGDVHYPTQTGAFADYDNDGDLDLYIGNDAFDASFRPPCQLFRNNGDGTFTDLAPTLDVAHPIMSFPMWFWDYDNDGMLDIYVGSYDWDGGNLGEVVASILGMLVGYELGRLYRNDGKGGFREVAKDLNLGQLTRPMGSNFGDLDNDGFLDFYLGTGYPDYESLMPNVMYLS